MSASQTPPSNPPGDTPAADPSMEDILASIRRILNEEEPAGGAAEAVPPPHPASPSPASPPPASPNVLALSKDMLVADTPPALPAPSARVIQAEPRTAPTTTADALLMGAGMASSPVPGAPPPQAGREHLVAPDAAAAAATSVGTLLRTLMNEREQVHVYRGGPTIEDLVREEVRGLLKVWLDANLPPMVERLVRSEIERVVGRAAS